MRPIIFLDFDGVLHPDPCARSALFKQSHWLVEALESMVVDIVISSDWRLTVSGGEAETWIVTGTKPISDLIVHLPEEIGNRVVAVTPYSKNLHGVASGRHRLCEAWLRDNRPDAVWLAIEDRDYFFDHNFANIYLCDSETGLTEADVVPLRDRIRDLVHSQRHLGAR